MLTSLSLFLGTVPLETISPFVVPIRSLSYQTGPFSAKIVVWARKQLGKTLGFQPLNPSKLIR